MIAERPTATTIDMMLRVLWICVGVAALSTPVGCRQECDLSALAALSLEVVDAESGEPIADATITYSVDGKTEEPVTADPGGGGRYALGYELPGNYVVHIEAPGHAAVDREYDIDDGECHVNGQQDTIELTPG
jgi:hypothetical protein